MGMNMAGEHCPNCGEELEDGQIGLCDFCTSESDGDTHGSPELDADARKLEAMGRDAGPTLAEIELPVVYTLDDPRLSDSERIEAMKNAIGLLAGQLERNQTAWQGEEDSVKEEHAELIEWNDAVLKAYGKFVKEAGK